ncbi:MAG: aspartate/glutamate racemase family protein [Clostridia bacterium]|nr:aspartate/glutamate racemase family protein [Clostridia bacterium]
MSIPKGGVGFFDSGIGGLTVLSACRKVLPKEVFYYLGDNGHAPYGNLKEEEIMRYVRKAMEKFVRLQARAVVIACNTVTAVCIERLRKEYPFPIIGAEPAVFSAAKKGGEVFVLTTRATFNSPRFQALCVRAGESFPNSLVKPIPCDVLAGAIEECLLEKDFDFTPLLPKGNPNGVVLGCTHYVYIEEVVKRYYGCEVYHGNEGIANRLRAVLKKGVEGADFCKNQGETTTDIHGGNFSKKKGLFWKKKAVKKEKNFFFENIYFLGKYGKINKKRHKQMFAPK